MLGVDRVGTRRSEAILARNFSIKTGDRQKNKRRAKKERNEGLWKVTPLMEIAHRD